MSYHADDDEGDKVGEKYDKACALLVDPFDENEGVSQGIDDHDGLGTPGVLDASRSKTPGMRRQVRASDNRAGLTGQSLIGRTDDSSLLGS